VTHFLPPLRAIALFSITLGASYAIHARSAMPWGRSPLPLAAALLLSAVLLAGAAPARDVIAPRIVGGSAVSGNRYPYSCSLRTSAGQHFCGGALIAPRVVLTGERPSQVAAACEAAPSRASTLCTAVRPGLLVRRAAHFGVLA
jgi:secreted trypsin-like serine protease